MTSAIEATLDSNGALRLAIESVDQVRRMLSGHRDLLEQKLSPEFHAEALLELFDASTLCIARKYAVIGETPVGSIFVRDLNVSEIASALASSPVSCLDRDGSSDLRIFLSRKDVRDAERLAACEGALLELQRVEGYERHGDLHSRADAIRSEISDEAKVFGTIQHLSRAASEGSGDVADVQTMPNAIRDMKLFVFANGEAGGWRTLTDTDTKRFLESSPREGLSTLLTAVKNSVEKASTPSLTVVRELQKVGRKEARSLARNSGGREMQL